MKLKTIPAAAALSLASISAAPGQATNTTIDQMPAALETRYALSALPPALRDQATVYLLDPKQGYRISRQGTNGLACLVERTQWELADYRNDLYVPLCYDAAGTTVHFQAMLDAAELRAKGMGPVDLKAAREKRYKNNAYRPAPKASLSYMVAPIQRTIAPPDLKVRAVAMPHIMFYAPHLTNEDIGAKPNLSDHSSLLHPF